MVVRRPVTNPMGALFGGGATRDAKADAAWIELVRSLRRRGPAAKTDTSIAAALSRLADADGDISLLQDIPACTCLLLQLTVPMACAVHFDVALWLRCVCPAYICVAHNFSQALCFPAFIQWAPMSLATNPWHAACATHVLVLGKVATDVSWRRAGAPLSDDALATQAAALTAAALEPTAQSIAWAL